MDDQVVDEIIDLYRWARVGNEEAADETLAGLIMRHLEDLQILDLAADDDALEDDATGVNPAPAWQHTVS